MSTGNIVIVVMLSYIMFRFSMNFLPLLFRFSFFNLWYIAEPSLLGDPFRRDVRYLASTEPPILSRLPWQAPFQQPQPHPQGGWIEDDASRGNFGNRTPGMGPEFQRGLQNSLSHGTQSSVPADLSHNQVKTEEVRTSQF